MMHLSYNVLYRAVNAVISIPLLCTFSDLASDQLGAVIVRCNNAHTIKQFILHNQIRQYSEVQL